MADTQTFLRDRCLTVLNLPEKGRSLFISRDFRPGSSLLWFRLKSAFYSAAEVLGVFFFFSFSGEVILRQEPYVSVPNNNSSESRCDGCFKTDGLKKCSGCQVVWYCGSSCQV